MLLFCAANLAVPLATSYAALVTLRVLAALAAAVVLPTVFGVTASLSSPDRQGRDLAAVMTGLTAAVVAGIPLGTWVGAALGWQATFVAGGLLGVVALVLLRVCVPEPPVPPAVGAAERLRPLTRPTVLLVLLAAVVAVAGNLMFQTYLAPFLEGAGDVGSAGLGGLLVLTGVAGVAGGRLSGTLVDRSGPARAFGSGGQGTPFARGGTPRFTNGGPMLESFTGRVGLAGRVALKTAAGERSAKRTPV